MDEAAVDAKIALERTRLLEQRINTLEGWRADHEERHTAEKDDYEERMHRHGKSITELALFKKDHDEWAKEKLGELQREDQRVYAKIKGLDTRVAANAFKLDKFTWIAGIVIAVVSTLGKIGIEMAIEAIKKAAGHG